jgi:hypothetical protein
MPRVLRLRTRGSTVSKELGTAREQAAAGQYKKAVNSLWDVERWARTDPAEARGLLEVASALREKTTGRLREQCVDLIDYAQKYIEKADEVPRVSLGTADYLGGYPAFGAPSKGQLSFTASAVFFAGMTLHMALVESLGLGGGQVAKSKLGAAVLFGVLGAVADKDAKDRAELVVHLKTGDAAFFFLQDTSAFEIRAKLMPLVREAGVPFKDELDEKANQRDVGVQPDSTGSLADELTKLAKLQESGFLTADELAAAKAKLLA